MKHELKHSLVELNYKIEIDEEFKLHGNMNSLVQVIDNLISNAIQSYGGKPDNIIDFIIEKDAKNLVISIKDYAGGLPKEISDKLFKEMNSYYIALIPMLLFGFYKNGILLFTNNIITFKSLIIPLYFYIISIIISFIISKILKEDYKENILIALISISTISLNSNIIIFPILLFVTLFIIKVLKNKLKLTINWLSFIHLSLLLSLLINSYSYLNIGETLDIFNYNLFDIFLGHGVGGISNTSTLILIFSLIILSLNKFYKKSIPIASSITFITINTRKISFTF